jgi:hypothetical protein
MAKRDDLDKIAEVLVPLLTAEQKGEERRTVEVE